MVKVDKETCIGCGSCSATCGKVFEMKGGKAQVKSDADKNADCVKEAVDGCPVGAISV